MNTTTELLVKFVNQRPGLEFANYGDVKAFRSEMREITKDRNDFFELLSLAQRRIENFDQKLTDYLQNNSGRLTLDNGRLRYVTGQYFPTEYRPAANNALRSLIWDDFRDEKDMHGESVYKSGHEIRKAIARSVSRRVAKNYFN